MGGHGQDAWPLSVALRLCILLLIAPAALRADPVLLKAAPEFTSAAAALDPVNWVMAQGDLATAASRALDPPAASLPAPPAPPARSRSALMQLFFQDSSEARPLSIAPIRWTGNLSFEQRFNRSGDGSGRSQSIEFASMQMSSYIGQPWLVQVRANLGVLAQQQRESNESLSSGSASAASSASLTGGATAAVFPSSRFPFTATFESSDSRTSGEATGADYVNRMMALRQAYRSPLGDRVYGASLERSTLISSSFGRDSVTALAGTMQQAFALQTVDVAGSYGQNRRSTGEGSDVSRLSARHSYRPSDLLMVNSSASFSMNDLSMGESALRSRFVQLNSFASWRPDEDSPMFVTGGVRMADAAFGSGNVGGSARSAGANLAMSYALSPQASLVAAGSVTHIRTDDSGGLVTTQSLAANYAPLPIALGLVSYSWNTSASLSSQTGAIDGAQYGVGGQANHQVSKGFGIGSAMSVNAAVNQGVSVLADSVRDPTTTLLHSGTLGLRINPNPASDAFASLSVGDSRSQGGREDRFQLLNLQLTGQLQLGVYSLVSANFTMQAINQRLQGDESDRTSVQRSGTINYQHGRLFGVRRLRLVVSATFNDMQLESRILGDPNAPRDQYTRLLETRLQYDIGRLEFRLGTRLATLDGRSDQQYFFRVNRQFGLY